MVRIALRNKKGGSLIELMISMGILAILAAALMKSSLLVLEKNVQNEMRDEAVRIAEQRMNEIRTGPGGFDNATAGDNNINLVAGPTTTLPDVNRIIRNVPVAFTTRKTVVSLETTTVVNTKSVTVEVSWTYRGKPYQHAIMSIARRYGQ